MTNEQLEARVAELEESLRIARSQSDHHLDELEALSLAMCRAKEERDSLKRDNRELRTEVAAWRGN